MKEPEKLILESWNKNVLQWTSAVRESRIESRKLVTDAAIVKAILSLQPQSVVDIGCGEGWLIRELSGRVGRLVGVDGVEGLVNQAKVLGGGEFHRATYEELAGGALDETFDTAVCNFSLLGDESVRLLFDALPSLLSPGGHFVVQTLHPGTCVDSVDTEDSWREGSWEGFGSDFIDPSPWYFRTRTGWESLFNGSGLPLVDVLEPHYPETQKPASIILIGALR